MSIKSKTITIVLLLISLFLLAACSSGNSNIEDKLINSQGWNKLSVAVYRGDIAKVRSLVVMGEDINHEGAYGDTPLKLAIENKKYLITKFLLKNGADASALDEAFLNRYDNTGEIRELIIQYQAVAELQKEPPAIVADVVRDDEEGLLPSMQGGPRIALVIGNSQYQFVPLRNPVNDAQDMSRVLSLASFDVTMVLDANRKKTVQAINQFSQKLGGGVALFYYSGHAVQVEGHNYMIPVGEAIDSQEKVKYLGIDMALILEKMGEESSSLNIVILDACRDNPLPKMSRSIVRGLTRVKSPAGTIIAFSTSPGETAEDGDGRNGTYTKYLLHYMKMPGLPIESVLKGVSRSVKNATNNEQQPWVETSFDEEFSFFSKK